jgi:predicted DCC family thiol-disulfide oxidoreductase YuxK
MSGPELTLYYDGNCGICRAEMARLRGWDNGHRLGFTDIAAPDFSPLSLGVSMAALNAEMHARTADGRLLAGIDSLLAAYTLVGRGWMVAPLRVAALRPVFSAMACARTSIRCAKNFTLYFCFYRNDGCTMTATAATMTTMMTTRTWLVRWIYAVVAMHLLVGVLLPLCAGSSLTEGYRRGIEDFFFGIDASAGGRALHVWWLSLFGPTVQAAAIWMAGLAVLGDKQRNAFAWAMLVLGLLVWAPQDMLISARAHCWTNLWIDIAAVAVMLPPLIWLFKFDLVLKNGKTT